MKPESPSLLFRFCQVFVTCGGIGFVPKGGGTVASVVALFFWLGLQNLGVEKWILGVFLLILIPLGVWASKIYEKTRQSEDASEIVLDEWVGMGLSLAFVDSSWMLAIAAFVLFRFFDISKACGIRYFDEHYLGGWGVMMDDVVAGIYTTILIGVYRWGIAPTFLSA